MFTLDGVPVTDRLPVWNQHLNLVRIDLSVPVTEEFGRVWFDTRTVYGYRAPMTTASDIYTVHPVTRQTAKSALHDSQARCI